VLCSIAILAISNTAHANGSDLSGSETVAGVIDGPPASNTAALDIDQVKKQVKKEQQELAKQERKDLEKKAKKGERLAQVALGDNYADEAQQLLFAPDAANDAISDALKWYSVAAQRGFPGTPSLNGAGVKFHPVRVIRDR